MLKKIGAVAFTLLIISPFAVSADTVSDLQAQIQALLAQLAALQQGSPPSPPSTDCTTYVRTSNPNDPNPCAFYVGPTPPPQTGGLYCPKITKNLERGSRHAEVIELQKFLSSYFQLDEDTLTGGFFGATTREYLVRFQIANGLPGEGNTGPRTRAKMAGLCGQSTSPICPQISPPQCDNGNLVSVGTDQKGCSKGYKCHLSNSCPQVRPMQCDNGTLVSLGTDQKGCSKGFRCEVSKSPSVDLKVNGSDGPVTVRENDPIAVSWRTSNERTCFLNNVRLTPGGPVQAVIELPSTEWTQGSRNVYVPPPHVGNRMNLVEFVCNRPLPDGRNLGVSDSVALTYVTGALNPIQVTAPNGGEQWEIGTLNTISWTPMDANVNTPNQINAFLVPEGTGSSGHIVPTSNSPFRWDGSIIDVGVFSIKYPTPGTYRIRIENSTTGQSDVSDNPFTLIATSRPFVDLKVNGMDGPIVLANNERVTLTLSTPMPLTFGSCHVTGIRTSIGGTPTSATMGATGHPPTNTGVYTFYAVVDAGTAMNIQIRCTMPDGTIGSDSIQVNPAAGDPLPAPVINSFTVTPLLVRSGEPVTISWNASNTLDGGCYVFPNASMNGTAINYPSNTAGSGSIQYAVTQQTTFTLKCMSSWKDGSPSVTKSLIVHIVPTFQEAGELKVSLDASSPQYKVVAVGSGGVAGVTIGALRFSATGEDMRLDRVALQLSGTTESSPGNITQVTLWDGATQVGTAIFAGSRTAVSTLTGTVVILANSSKTLTIKGDLAGICTSCAGTPGALIRVDYDNDADGFSNSTRAIGISSGSTINRTSTADTAVAGVRTQRSVPTITYSQTPGALTNGTQQLATVNIAADPKGDVQIRKLTFRVSSAGLTFDTPTFTGPNGSVGSVRYEDPNLIVVFNSSTNVSDAIIPAGTTKTYTLGGTISGLSGTTAGVLSFSLRADRSHSPSGGLMAPLSEINGSTFWSPLSHSSSVTTTSSDWTNGYGLGGCFAMSGIGQDCMAISKTQASAYPATSLANALTALQQALEALQQMLR